MAGAVEIANFLEASRAVEKGPYDVVLVEGSITTPHDAERIHQIRRSATLPRHDRRLRDGRRHPGAAQLQGRRRVHPRPSTPRPQYIETLNKSTPIADHVFVDFELRGCPINKTQLVEVAQRLPEPAASPNVPTYSVCIECKRRGTLCVMVAHGTPCLGPVTQAGCGALCPSYARGCYGCFGPMETPNTASLAAGWTQLGVDDARHRAGVPLLQRGRRGVPAGERDP